MGDFVARDPQFEARVRDSFARQKLMATIGAELVRVAPGEVDIELPKGVKVQEFPVENLLVQTFKGNPEDYLIPELKWIEETARANPVKPGYRERLAKVGSPDSPDWEVEVQLVLK